MSKGLIPLLQPAPLQVSQWVHGMENNLHSSILLYGRTSQMKVHHHVHRKYHISNPDEPHAPFP